MPIIKARPNRVRTLRHICRLQEPNRDVLLDYARFIGDSVDYVLNQLIDATLAKDREFLAWRADQRSAAPVTTKLRSDQKPSATHPEDAE
jgi:hypothetical protein